MRFFAFGVLLAAAALCSAGSQQPDSSQPEKVTVGQLQQRLAAAKTQTDTEIARQLSGVELIQRLPFAHWSRLNADLPGPKSRQALLLLTDKSAFLGPPEEEIPADPVPTPAATRQMLVHVVNYVNTTLRQLPNLIAVRTTASFEDRPQKDNLEATGIVSYSYLPLHLVGGSSDTVTYRDHKEEVNESRKDGATHNGKTGGLVTTGEFGPILIVVVGDAIKGSITWARWELGANGTEAVFHYAVPADKSHYRVRFCCIVDGFAADGQANMQVFDELAGYHGEIAFNPADGSILRITVEAEMPSQELVPNAGIVIDYSPVQIGGKSYVCPERSVSLLSAHVNPQQGMASKAFYKGPAKTFLNDVEFSSYRRFGSESRIVIPGTAASNP
ncbi:MAG: hypothetical protein KGM96_05165 [Acidobacteriota bacterium]|nr:hypothetical protein [Acidobacteriota bacterium]